MTVNLKVMEMMIDQDEMRLAGATPQAKACVECHTFKSNVRQKYYSRYERLNRVKTPSTKMNNSKSILHKVTK